MRATVEQTRRINWLQTALVAEAILTTAVAAPVTAIVAAHFLSPRPISATSADIPPPIEPPAPTKFAIAVPQATETQRPPPTATLVIPPVTATRPPDVRPAQNPVVAQPSPDVARGPNGEPVISRVIIKGEIQSQSLNCEATGAAVMARAMGYNITSADIMAQLRAYGDDLNPDHGFVGNPNGSAGSTGANGFGVFVGPLARALQDKGISAEAHKNQDISYIENQLKLGKSVFTIAVYGLPDNAERVNWPARDGTTVNTYRFEHSFLVIGQTQDSFLVYNSAPTSAHPMYEWAAKTQFAKTWNMMGAQTLVINPQ